ncbi:MAG: PaaI family thioesterase [Marmoricola sp.]
MSTPFLPTIVKMTPEEHAAEIATYKPLADAVRRLSLASLRTQVNEAEIAAVTEQIDALSDRLEAQQIEGAFGVNVTAGGAVRGYGNAVVGMRNPIAVPLTIVQDREAKRADAQFHLGPLYEGPPNCVHGGVVALMLDQISGEAAAAGGVPGMTGTLTVRYEKPTPLGDCSASAWVDSVEGVKTVVKGEFRAADGSVTATCQGLFIIPRWVREMIAEGAATAPSGFE